MFWFLVLVGLLIITYFALIKPFNYWKGKGIPQYPFWVTWRETLLSFVQYRPLTESFQMLYDDFPERRYCGIYQFYKPALAIRDPDLIKQITVKDFDHFVDHFQFIPENCEPLWEKNLFSLKGDKWRDMRATLSPSFTGSKMKVMFSLISECSKQFVKYFQDQKQKVVSVEMRDIFTRFTNDVIASAAFGVTVDSLRDRNNDFYLMGKKITSFDGVFMYIRFLMILLLPKLSNLFGITIFDYKTSNFFKKVVKDNIETREKNGIVRQDMIHLLMEARKGREKNDKIVENGNDAGFAIVDDPSGVKEEKRTKEQLTDDDITAQALIFFFAGFDSVATLMCFLAHELAVNPDVHQQLQNEIDDTLNDCGGSITYDALFKMKYMDMVVSEALRKWPIAIALDRMCVKPYTIQPVKQNEKPLHLKEGDIVWMPIYGMQRDPEFYSDPERFDPERFSDENKSNIVPYTYLPFGTGPRNCIGNRFALMEIKLIFFHILNKFDITVVEKTKVPLKIARSQVQLTAEGGFWLGLKSRKTE